MAKREPVEAPAAWWSLRVGLTVKVEAPAKTLDSALRVDDALLTRIEGVALAANLDPERRFGGAGIEDVPAGAGDGGLEVLGMDFCFHIVASGYSLYAAVATASAIGYTLTRRLPLASHS